MAPTADGVPAGASGSRRSVRRHWSWRGEGGLEATGANNWAQKAQKVVYQQ